MILISAESYESAKRVAKKEQLGGTDWRYIPLGPPKDRADKLSGMRAQGHELFGRFSELEKLVVSKKPGA